MPDNHVSTHAGEAEQHSLAASVTLHLLPGILILAFFVTVTPLLTERGLPTLLCLFLAVAVVLIPFELGYLLYQARRSNETDCRALTCTSALYPFLVSSLNVGANPCGRPIGQVQDLPLPRFIEIIRIAPLVAVNPKEHG